MNIEKGRWYPNQPPRLPGEGDDAYTNRLTGFSGPELRPFDHSRNRQCSIGWHGECSDRGHYGVIDKTAGCGCPCHEWRLYAAKRVADWNARYPVGTAVCLPLCPEEPPTVTCSEAFVGSGQHGPGWPVVRLEGWPVDNLVELSWLEAGT